MHTIRASWSAHRPAVIAAALALGVLVAATAARAQTWNEVGDAGDLPATAQVTAGTGALATITGSLDSPADVDMYCIHLSAALPAGSTVLQLLCVVIQGPNVWLFDAAGNGVQTNETCAGGGKTLVAPGTGLGPGAYYVAVSNYGIGPQSAGGAMWLTGLAGPRAPDGPGAVGPVIGWSGTPIVNPLNPYQLNLFGFDYCSAPTPVHGASWGMLKTIYR